MLFVSIMLAILIPQDEQTNKQGESFKYNNAAVELFQQMEGEWKFEKVISLGKERPLIAFEPDTVVVSDYKILLKRTGYESVLSLVAFDSDLNAFKIDNSDGDFLGRTGLVTCKNGKLIIVYRSLKFGKAPVSIKPNAENQYCVFGKK